MIVVRDEFQLKFGVAREAVAIFQEGIDFARRSGTARDVRLLTDLTGTYYTLVLESTYDDLSAYEREMRQMMGDAQWKAWYARFVPLAQSGRREMFTLVGSVSPPSSSSEREPSATARA
jgi:hypothetical protein